MNCSETESSTTLEQKLKEPSLSEKLAEKFDSICQLENANKNVILHAFKQTALALPVGPDREQYLRDLAKTAILITARGHGNIIETGRALLSHVDELGAEISANIALCKDEVMLGLAEGACQVGPIVYGRFLDIASEYRTNADEWIQTNKRKHTFFEPDALIPLIVPYEEDLTITSKPFRDEPAEESPLPKEASQKQPADTPSPTLSSSSQWSRPKQRGFFRRLSDVIGGFFHR